MIYTISEYLATVTDAIVLILFLILSLSWKLTSKVHKIILTIAFIGIYIADVTLLNKYIHAEGFLAITYIAVLFVFCLIALRGKWYHKLLLVLTETLVLFLINALISAISAWIIGSNLNEIVTMRNPARIFLLIISKFSLIFTLFPVARSIKRGKWVFRWKQIVIAVLLIIFAIITGSVVEKLIFDNVLNNTYSLIILGTLSAICVLLILLVVQFSIESHIAIENTALQTRLHDEKKKMNELINWSQSIRSLHHDINNHMMIVERYIEDEQIEKALDYIKTFNEKNRLYPSYTNTETPVLNAILDGKRMICKNDNINLKCYLQTDPLGVDDFVFCTVFGNLLDNAIEAERKEDNKEIRLAVETKGSLLHIVVQNRIHEPVLINGKLPKTDKKDSENHGIGVANIISTVSQQNGSIDIYEKDEWFVVDVLLPCKQKA